jgi:Ca2+-binding RTX toxin-like protein
VAGAGVATMVGGAGNDTFIVDNVNDVVQDTYAMASNAIDSSVSYSLPNNINTLQLTGSANLIATANTLAADSIIANAGNDTLVSNYLIDTLVGGSGNDLFVVNNASDVVSVGGVFGNDTVEIGSSYTLPANMANLTLTGSANISGTLGSLNGVLTGNAGSDNLTAGPGNDTIYGGSGGDYIQGGAGNDALYAGSGGTSANPTYIVDPASHGQTTFYGGSGVDIFEPFGSETIVAGSGTGYIHMPDSGILPTIVLNNGFGSLHVSPEDNGPDAFNLEFGTGISPSALGITEVADGSNAALQITDGTSTFLDQVSLFPVEDPLSEPIAGINTMSFADSGSLTLAQLIAQAHATSATVVTAGSGEVDFSVGNGATVAGGSGSPDVISAWGNNDTLTGGTSNSRIYAGGNNDVVYAGSGNHVSILAPGTADTLSGGPGSATFYISGASDVVAQPTANAGLDSILSSVSYTLPTNVPILTLTGTAALVGTANSDTGLANGYADSEVNGNSGNDTLVAGAGVDDLVAGSGNQLLLGGSGTSYLYAGSGNDTLEAGTGIAIEYAGTGSALLVINNTADTVYGSTGNATVQSSVNFTIPTGISAMALTGSANLVASDEFGDNAVITANSGNDSLYSYSTTAVDTLVAGTGNDYFYIRNPADIVQIGTTHGNDSVEVVATGVSYTILPNIDNLQVDGQNNYIVGNSDNESISGQGGDTIVAGSGTDTLVSAYGGDTLVGGGGNDVFVVGINPGTVIQDTYTTTSNIVESIVSFTLPTNVNTLTFTQSNNVIGMGNAGNDLLTANSGNDTLVSGTGIDTLVGGTGNDWYVLNNPSDVLQSLSSGSNTIQAAFSYTLPTNASTLILSGTANLTGTANSGNDTLTTNAGIDTLTGGSGNDTFVVTNTSDMVADTSTTATNIISSSVSFSLPSDVNRLILTGSASLLGTANGANDTLTANSGTDTLISATGTAVDSLVGGTGNDLFVINDTADIVTVGSTHGVDTIQSSVSFNAATNVADLVFTGTANVAGTGNSLANVISGNSGADTLTSGSGVATLVGGAGNDVFVINNTLDIVQDTSTSTTNALRSSVVYSLPTNVNALVLTGTSALKGTANSANDTLTANSGADTLVGGAGSDVFVISNTLDVVTDTSTTATNALLSTVNYTLPNNVNALTFTGSTALLGQGNAGNDSMTANSGADTLVAGNGTDTLVSGAAGADSLVAGTGNDLFIINYAGDIVTVGATHGADTIQAAVSYTASPNVANLTLSGTSNLVGTGNTIADVIRANSGNDTLTAGSGVATLVGGSGNDTFVINSASDVIQDTSTTATNVLSSSVSYTLATNVNRLLLTGTAALVGTANTANDTLTANTGADTLVSGTGAAVDSLVGGTGADLFVVNNTSDIVNVGTTHGVDTIQSSVSYSASANVANLVLTSTTALSATGNSLAGTLTANTGSDTLTAGSGADTLVAGTGNDLFVINSASDVVSVGSTHGLDTIHSSVSYTASANVANLTLTGTSALAATGNTLANALTANSGADTLTAGSGVATLVGGAGNDTFVVNSASDVVQDTSTTATNILSSSVSYTLAINVNRLILTGTAALIGTANTGNDTLTANTGADTLVSGTGAAVDSLVGGSGADLFVVNNALDIVNVGTTHGVDTIQSSVSYTASANVANLTLTGTAALSGVGNSLAGMITANTGNDTLTAGSAADTLVGGAGTDTFIVNSASDVVSLGTSGTSDTIQSSASYTLPTNVQYLTLSGTAALAGTGNNLLDLIVGNTGSDTLAGGTGIAVLEGGRTAGADQIKAASNQAALIGGGGSSTLTGGAFKDFYAAGKVSDSLTTGATANVVSVNSGDGATTLQPTTGATDVLSLGAGIDTENLKFTKTGNNLILSDGVTGDSITLANWYVGGADQDVTTLQVVEIASANYNSAGTDGLRNKALEDFNFTSLVAAYTTAGSPANWALSTAMPSAQLTSTSTADYGGDLAYYFGLNGNLTGVDLSAAQSTLTNASFATANQTIDSFSSISGGGGLHLLVAEPPKTLTQPIVAPTPTGIASETAATPETAAAIVSATPTTSTTAKTATVHATTAGVAATNAVSLNSQETYLTASPSITPTHSPEQREPSESAVTTRVLTPRRGIENPAREPTSGATAVTASQMSAAVAVLDPRRTIEPMLRNPTNTSVAKSYVDPINVAWLRMHASLDQTQLATLGGAEATTDHEEVSTDALLSSVPLSRTKRFITDPDLHSSIGRQRAM